MDLSVKNQRILQTSAGDFPLEECRLRLPDRELSIQHVAAMVSHSDESRFLLESTNPLPYGIALWSSTIALAQDVIARADDIKGKRVLELGAGTGLPGIVAACLLAEKVVQTDKNKLAMSLCKRNCELNGIKNIEHRLADWTDWNDTNQYDWILGSDIFYGIDMHSHLIKIFDFNLAPGGRVLISDPFRGGSLPLLESMEENGWSVSISKWSINDEEITRFIGVFELSKS